MCDKFGIIYNRISVKIRELLVLSEISSYIKKYLNGIFCRNMLRMMNLCVIIKKTVRVLLSLIMKLSKSLLFHHSACTSYSIQNR